MIFFPTEQQAYEVLQKDFWWDTTHWQYLYTDLRPLIINPKIIELCYENPEDGWPGHLRIMVRKDGHDELYVWSSSISD